MLSFVNINNIIHEHTTAEPLQLSYVPFIGQNDTDKLN